MNRNYLIRIRNGMHKVIQWTLIFSFALGTAACQSMGGSSGYAANMQRLEDIPDAVPKAELRSKHGNPSSYVVAHKRYHVLKQVAGYNKVGKASWYSNRLHGQRTSTHESYDMYSMTAASPVLPLPSYVRVTNLKNGKSVVVKVNDRGPFQSDRIIDLSYAAAAKLGYTRQGTARVRVVALMGPVDMPIRGHRLLAYQTKNRQHSGVAELGRSTYLRVGSFRSRHHAEDVSHKIKRAAKLPYAQIAVKKVGERLYHVHIGPLKEGHNSQHIQRVLAKHGFNAIKIS